MTEVDLLPGGKTVGLLERVIRRLCRRPRLERVIVLSRSLDGPQPFYECLLPLEIETLSGTAEEIKALLSHLPVEETYDIEERLKRGDGCVVAKHDGRVVYVAWAGFKKCYSYLLDREYELANGEVFGYGAYTVPEYRGKGIHPTVGCRMHGEMREKGYKRALSFIDPKNLPAISIIEKYGLERVGVSGYVEVFGIRWYFHWGRGAFSALTKRHYLRKV